MLTKKLLGTGLCVAALGWSAARLYGEVMIMPEASPYCADGECIPRRVTNGYFQTKWRRWPVEPPAPARPGIRPGIAAPPVELPEPRTERDLPQGAIQAPRPQEEGGAAPDNGRAPRPRRTAPPADRAPGVQPQPGLPPELRNEMPSLSFDDQGSRLPPDNRSPRRIPAIASRGRSRQAAMVEALRDEARWQPTRGNHQAAESRIPGILPSDDEANAEPLRTTPAEAAPRQPAPQMREPNATRASFSRDKVAYRNEPARSIDQANDTESGSGWSAPNETSKFAGELPTELPTAVYRDESHEVELSDLANRPSASTRLGARLSALRQSAAETDDSAGWTGLDDRQVPVERWESPSFDAPSFSTGALDARQHDIVPRPSLRLSAADPNSPAAVRVRQIAEGTSRASAPADLTISATGPSDVLAVRTRGEDRWSRNSSTGNPLRGGSEITRVIFETAAAPDDDRRNARAGSQPATEPSATNLTIPANPLR